MVYTITPSEQELLQYPDKAKALAQDEEIRNLLADTAQAVGEDEELERLQGAAEDAWRDNSLKIFETLKKLPENETKNLITLAYEANDQYFNLSDDKDNLVRGLSYGSGEKRGRLDLQSILSSVRKGYIDEGRQKEYLEDEAAHNMNFSIRLLETSITPEGKGAGSPIAESWRVPLRLGLDKARWMGSIIGGGFLTKPEEEAQVERFERERDIILKDPEIQSSVRHYKFLKSLNLEKLYSAQEIMKEEDIIENAILEAGIITADIDGPGLTEIIPNAQDFYMNLREDLGIESEEDKHEPGIWPQISRQWSVGVDTTFPQKEPPPLDLREAAKKILIPDYLQTLHDTSKVLHNMGRIELKGAISTLTGIQDAASFILDLAAFGWGERVIRYGLLKGLDDLKSAGYLMKMNEVVARLPDTMLGRAKARRIRKKTDKVVQLRKGPAGLGGLQATIDRDIRHINYALGGGYLSLELLGVDVENGLGGAGALLLAGIFLPPVITKIGAKLGGGHSAMKRLDMYLHGGGDVDTYLLESPEFAAYAYTKKDLAQMSTAEKLSLARISAQEYEQIGRFAKVLREIADDPKTKHIHDNMIRTMRIIRKRKTDMLEIFESGIVTKVGGKKLEVEDVADIKERFTVFLDQYIQSQTLTAVREALVQMPTFGKLRALNRKVIFSDMERILGMELDQQEFLASIFLQLSPALREGNQVARSLNDQITRMLTENLEATIKAQQHVAQLQNVKGSIEFVEAQRVSPLYRDKVLMGDAEVALTAETDALLDSVEPIVIRQVDISDAPAGEILIPSGIAVEKMTLSRENLPSSTVLQYTAPFKGNLVLEVGQKQENVIVNNVYVPIKSHFDTRYTELRKKDLTVILENKKAASLDTSEEISETVNALRRETKRTETLDGGLEITYGDGSTELIPPVRIADDPKMANIRKIENYTEAEIAQFNTIKENVGTSSLSRKEVSRTTSEEGEIIIRFDDDSTERIPPIQKGFGDTHVISFNFSQSETGQIYHADLYTGEGSLIRRRYTENEKERFFDIQNGEPADITLTESSRKELNNGDIEITWDTGKVDLIPDFDSTSLELDTESMFTNPFTRRTVDAVPDTTYSASALARFKGIREGDPAVKEVDLEYLTEAERQAGTRFHEITPTEQEALFRELVDLDKDITRGFRNLKNKDKLNLGVRNYSVSEYLRQIRRDHIASFKNVEGETDAPARLAEYLEDKILELQAIAGKGGERTLGFEEIDSLQNSIKLLREKPHQFEKIKQNVMTIFENLDDAGVVINANDLHQMAKQFGFQAGKFTGDPKGWGASYGALEKQTRAILSTLFPDYRNINKEYAQEIFGNFQGGPMQKVLNLDKNRQRKIPNINLIDTFLDDPDIGLSVKQFNNLINPSPYFRSQLTNVSEKSIQKNKEELMELLFFRIGTRMQNNASNKKAYVDNQLAQWVSEAEKTGMFKGYEDSLESLKTINARQNVMMREIDANITKAKNRLEIAIRETERRTQSGILSEASKFKTDEEFAEWLFTLPTEDIDRAVNEFAQMPVYDQARYLAAHEGNITALELKRYQGSTPKDFVQTDLKHTVNRYIKNRFMERDPTNTFLRKYVKDNEGVSIDVGGKLILKGEHVLDYRLAYARKVKFPELNDFLHNHTEQLYKLGYSKEHVDHLKKLSELGIAIKGGKSRFVIKDVPRPFTVPNILSRTWAIYREVIGIKYVASEAAARLFRQKEAEALDKLLSSPDIAAAVLHAFEGGRATSAKLMNDKIAAMRVLFTIAPEGEVGGFSDSEIREVILRSYVGEALDLTTEEMIELELQ